MAKKKVVEKIEETWEQKRDRELKRFLEERTKFIPEPTYKFNIGERVMIGALEDVYIVESIQDGKVYEIDFTSVSNNYGNPIRQEHQRRFEAWFDIRPFNITNKETFIKNQDLILNYSNRSMGDIFTKAYYFGINFDPEYQREYVWELDEKVNLIDSIFNNIDIGKFVFIHKGWNDEFYYEILDGKQRIRAILDYYENKFAYKGKFFNELSNKDKNHFTDYPITMAEVRDISKKQVLKYFVKLNKHGKVMDKKQIEKVEKMIEEIENKT